MPNPIPAPDLIPFKKGTRVQHADSGIFGTVYQDQTDPLLVHICWDKTPFVVECYKADAVLPAPWHGVNWKDVGTVADEGLVEKDTVDPVHLKNFADAGLLNVPKDTAIKRILTEIADDLEASDMYSEPVRRNTVKENAVRLRGVLELL